jgi:hypothetical protein
LYEEIVAVTGLSHFTSNCPNHSRGNWTGLRWRVKACNQSAAGLSGYHAHRQVRVAAIAGCALYE